MFFYCFITMIDIQCLLMFLLYHYVIIVSILSIKYSSKDRLEDKGHSLKSPLFQNKVPPPPPFSLFLYAQGLTFVFMLISSLAVDSCHPLNNEIQRAFQLNSDGSNKSKPTGSCACIHSFALTFNGPVAYVRNGRMSASETHDRLVGLVVRRPP